MAITFRLPSPQLNTGEVPMSSAMTLPHQQVSIDARILPEIIEAYFEAKATDISEVTMSNYRIQLLPFMAFWKQKVDVHQYTLSPAILTAAKDWIKNEYINTLGKHPHPTTVFNCFTRMRGVLNWAFRNNCTGTINVAEWCPKLRRGNSELYFPTLDELALMMEMPSDEYRLRDIAIMAWLTSTGARLFETANATVENITFNTPLNDVMLGHDHAGYCHLRFTKGDNKGERGGRYVAFCKEAGLLLKCYLRSVLRNPEDTIFGLTDKGVAQVISRHGATADLPDISPHAFRRLFTDHWDEVHRMDYRAVLKKQLGHSLRGQDITEEHYLNGKNKRRIVGALQEHHVSPLSKIDIDWGKFPVHIEPISS
ncbi:MAG: hypothetical protein IT328_04380 [Caldilineaceae bacterium]|nr:hypothetical protein [Caldilineaceae bacterium]